MYGLKPVPFKPTCLLGTTKVVPFQNYESGWDANAAATQFCNAPTTGAGEDAHTTAGLETGATIRMFRNYKVTTLILKSG